MEALRNLFWLRESLFRQYFGPRLDSGRLRATQPIGVVVRWMRDILVKALECRQGKEGVYLGDVVGKRACVLASWIRGWSDVEDVMEGPCIAG